MRRTTAIQIVFALLALAFFASPIALRAVGVTAEAFENRRFAEAPKASQGWDAFQQASRFLTDRMPLRAEAVRANTRIWRDLFDTEPRYGRQAALQGGALPLGDTPPEANGAAPVLGADFQVVEGRDGWLFLEQDQNRACHPSIPHTQALERWSRLIRAVRRSGRRAILVVAPDKTSIYPEHIRADRLEDCAIEGKRRLWQLLRQLPPGDGIAGLNDALLRRKVQAGDDLYARKDSHWTSVGSLSMVSAVLERLGGGVTIERGDLGTPRYLWYTGDLTELLGASEVDFQLDQPIRRGADEPRIPGRAMIVGDSFSNKPLPQLEQYFRKLERIPWNGSEPERLAEVVAGADVVIFQTVERDLTFRAMDGGPVMSLLAELSELDRRER